MHIDPQWMASAEGMAAIDSLTLIFKNNSADERSRAAVLLNSLGWTPTADHDKVLYLVAQNKSSDLFALGLVALVPMLYIWAPTEDTPETKLIRDALKLLGTSSPTALIAAARGEIRNAPNYKVKSNAVRCLSILGTSSLPALPEILDALADNEPDVKRSAIFCLGQMGIGAQSAVPDLINAWSAPSGFLYFDPDIVATFQIKDVRIIEPILRSLFMGPQVDDDHGKRTPIKMLTTFAQGSAVTHQVVALVTRILASQLRTTSDKYPNGSTDSSPSEGAVAELCKLQSVCSE